MLIIPDQPTLGISRERRLPGSGQSKEQRGAPVTSLVCRTVHRGYTVLRKRSLHHGKDRFFDLAGVLGAGDQDASPLEVDRDPGDTRRLMPVRVGLEPGSVENSPAATSRVVAAPGEKEVAGEQRRPGALGNDTDRQVELWVRASREVHEVTIFAAQIIDDVGVKPGESVRRHRL